MVALYIGLPRWCNGKEYACQCRRHKRRGFDPWVRKILWSRKWQPTPVFLPGKFHEKWSLVGYSPWVCKESDLTEHACARAHTHTHTPLIYKSDEEYRNTGHIFLITADRFWLSQLEMSWNAVLTVVETASPLFLTALPCQLSLCL